MLIAHLPAGYILGRLARDRPGARSTSPDGLAWAVPLAMFASILPDLDLFWFYFVDNRAIHHHRYWVHIPFFWMVVAMVILPILWRSRWRDYALLFLAAIFLHLLMDTVGGGIMWGAPFNTHLYTLVEVPATRSHFLLSFIFHWSFLLELAICAVAGVMWWRR